MSTYADPPILDWLDSMAAAIIRAPSWCRRLLASALLTNATPDPITAATAIPLAAGQHLLLLPDPAALQLSLDVGTLTTGAAHVWITTSSAATLTITPDDDPVSVELVTPSQAADRVIIIDQAEPNASSPAVIIAPPRLTDALEADGYYALEARLLIGILGNGNPAGGGPVNHRRYEVASMGRLGQDLVEQSHLGLLRWQIVAREQTETMLMDPTGPLRGRYISEMELVAEGTA